MESINVLPINSKKGCLTTKAKVLFSDLGISNWLSEQCSEMGLKAPTSIQEACIPPALDGADVIGCAKTGTGKTLAFALPIMEKLARDPFGIYALVLTPTRELAFQIADQFRVLGKPIGVKVAVIVGGRDMIAQSCDIDKKPHILIATPGRLADHINSGNQVPLKMTKFLVLDEADRLLDGQYADQLEPILSCVPKTRQTLLFSATITDALNKLHEVSMKKPFFWEDKSDTVTVKSLNQRFVLCPSDYKDAYLVYVVKKYLERKSDASILIFSHTCRECQALAVMFQDLKFKCGALHSMNSQAKRLEALAKFRNGTIPILLCTDVAARGLDIPGVDLVVNHNVPQVWKNYVHRVGRAARAGRTGDSIVFVTQYDISLVKNIESEIHMNIEQLHVSDAKVSKYVTEVLVAKREAQIKLDEQKFEEKRQINRKKQMILAGLDPEDVEKVMKRQAEKREHAKGKRDKAFSKKQNFSKVDKVKTGRVKKVK